MRVNLRIQVLTGTETGELSEACQAFYFHSVEAAPALPKFNGTALAPRATAPVSNHGMNRTTTDNMDNDLACFGDGV